MLVYWIKENPNIIVINTNNIIIHVAQNEENDVFSLLEADLDIQGKEGEVSESRKE